MAALTDTSSTSEITLALIADIHGDKCLLTKDTPLHSAEDDNVLEIHSPSEILLASKDCVIESYPEGAWDHTTHTLTATTKSGPHNVLTFADSAANKHCFVERSDFTTYFPLTKPDEGQPANKGGQFCIIGHSAVMKTIVSGGLRTTITFKDAVHTPDLIVVLHNPRRILLRIQIPIDLRIQNFYLWHLCRDTLENQHFYMVKG
ncbi:uncharacterized protein LACBIDRAFT_327844 [Laccaria bicolor S238N-H82]|uniref:Predicted protein n=1 Tax=Laccaria bicolor (strain S238N-H82 / ATCC MYA-4686) TaxID=486041 RepID=B0DD02_LACBS|nr:uncharacterized protein LACBIDRAFT_327844 [Laccaria bicolor S238N-H82]EDR07387.1 predicted protein [Laccaria bicolor S238N-H82]|eukprot:XP_001881779.1 predicted protein [Laccaria bicolor S238N-H82]